MQRSRGEPGHERRGGHAEADGDEQPHHRQAWADQKPKPSRPTNPPNWAMASNEAGRGERVAVLADQIGDEEGVEADLHRVEDERRAGEIAQAPVPPDEREPDRPAAGRPRRRVIVQGATHRLERAGARRPSAPRARPSRRASRAPGAPPGYAMPASIPPICTPVCLSEKMKVRWVAGVTRARISELAGVSIAQAMPIRSGTASERRRPAACTAARARTRRDASAVCTTRTAPSRAIRLADTGSTRGSRRPTSGTSRRRAAMARGRCRPRSRAPSPAPRAPPPS